MFERIREIRLMQTLLKESSPYFRLFARVIQLDGVASSGKNEIAVEFLKEQFPYYKMESIKRFLNDALIEYRKSPNKKTIEMCCDEILSARKLKYENLRNMMRYLFLIAYDSMGIEEKEILVLRQIAQTLGLLKWDLLSLEYEFEYRLYEGQRRKVYQKEDNTHRKQQEQQKKQEEKEQQSSDRQHALSRQRLEMAYDLLSLSPSCSETDIKQAYRSKAKQFHPDALSKDCTERELELATEQFRQVTEAYNYLCTIREIK